MEGAELGPVGAGVCADADVSTYDASSVLEVSGTSGMSGMSGTTSSSTDVAPRRIGVASRGKNAPCTHNSWDNVRVIKGQVTLRCRLCQLQWRTHVDAVWRKRKCGFFNTAQGCSLGEACPKIHMHAKKQSLEERVERHGDGVLSAVQPAVERVEEVDTEAHNTRACDTPPCPHNAWNSVRAKKGTVTLRCGVCVALWRCRLAHVDRCRDFPECALGEACTKVHMHVVKVADRVQGGGGGAACGAAGEEPQIRASTAPAAAPQHSIEVFSCGLPQNWRTVPLVEGVQAWYDSTACYSNVASWAGATLVQGTSMPIPSGPLVLKLTSVDPSLCAMVHAVHSGAFSTSLEMHGWVRVQTAPMPRIGAQEAVMHSFAVKPSQLPNGMFSLPSAENNVMCSVFVSFGATVEAPTATGMQYLERSDIYGNCRVAKASSYRSQTSHTSAVASAESVHMSMSASQTQLSISASASECSTEDDHHSESEKTPTASRGRSHARGGRQSPRGSTPDAHSSDDDCDSDHDASAQRSSSCPPALRSVA